MKKLLFVLVLFLICFTALSAQENPIITIVNNTGSEINAFYIRQTGTDSWKKYTFTNNQSISNGQSFNFQLPDPLNKVNQYDLRLERADGKTYTRNKQTISANERIQFTSSNLDGLFDGPAFKSLEDLFE